MRFAFSSTVSRPTSDINGSFIHQQAERILDFLSGLQPPRGAERLRDSEIDALSTLGLTAAHYLVETPGPVQNWPVTDKQRLTHRAQLRTRSMRSIVSAFPELLHTSLIDEPGQIPDYVGDIPEDALPDSCEYQPGDLPILLTAPHDGHAKSLGGGALTHNLHSIANDGATSFITRDTHAFLAAQGQPAPYFLIDHIKRSYRTPETRAYFETRIFETVCEMRRRFGPDQPLLHLDIHGFGSTLSGPSYDLILGTAHRKTIAPLTADHALATFMKRRGYATYVPAATPQPNEYFMAENPATLVQRVRSLGLAAVGGIQIEINRKFRTSEAIAAGKKLARDLGDFCLHWA